MSPYAVHRNPDHWTDPERFIPERFMDEEAKHHDYAFIPFGTGVRNCIGEMFAKYQLLIFAAKIFSKLKFSIEPGYKMEYYKGNFVMTPKKLWVKVNLRS